MHSRLSETDRAHLARVKSLACSVCDAPGPSESMRPVPGLPHTFASEQGEIYSNHPGNRWAGEMVKLASGDNGRGYLRVKVHGKMRAVHRLVASAYVGPIPDGMEVNHRDGDKTNNRPENLEYMTRSENMQHAKRLGLRRDPKGERHRFAKISDAQADELLREYKLLIENGPIKRGKVADLARRYGVRGDYPRDLYMGRARVASCTAKTRPA